MAKKRVKFSFPVTFMILETNELREYRNKYWEFVCIDRMRVADKISGVLTSDHREKVWNGFTGAS